MYQLHLFNGYTVFWYSFVNQTHTIIHLRFFRALGNDQFSWENTAYGISYKHMTESKNIK